jgi:hypothetical protein
MASICQRDLAENAPSVFEQVTSGCGQLHAAGQPQKQRRAGTRFQALNTASQGGLGDMQVLRGRRDLANLRHVNEIADGGQIH